MAKKTHPTDRRPVTPSSNTDLVRSFLLEIGRVPLLTKEQEVLYGKQVQKMMALQALQDSLIPKGGLPLTPREWATQANLSEAELQQILQEGQRAQQKMIEANLRLVVSIAKKVPET